MPRRKGLALSLSLSLSPSLSPRLSCLSLDTDGKVGVRTACVQCARCTCTARATRVHCVCTAYALCVCATNWPRSPSQPSPPQPLTGLTASRSPVSPLQAVSIELRNQPAFCREEDMDVLVEVPSLGRVPNPNPNPTPTLTPTPNQVPSFGQVRLDIAHDRMLEIVSSQ